MTTPTAASPAAALTVKGVLSDLEGLIGAIHSRAAVVEALSEFRFKEIVAADGYAAASAAMRAENVAVMDLAADAERLAAKLTDLQRQAGIMVP